MSAYSDVVLADSPLLYWRLGEGAGTNADDATANDRDGTYAGSYTLGAAGALSTDPDSSVSMSGTGGDKITSSYAPFVTGGSGHTFEAWVNRTSTSGYHTIFGASGSSSPLVRMESGTDKLEFFARNGGGGSWASSGIGTGVWRHVVVTFSGIGEVAELFVDGASRGQITGTQDYITASAGNFQMGDSGIAAGSWPWYGGLDEVALYSGVLSGERIFKHYRTGQPYIGQGVGGRAGAGRAGTLAG